MASAAASKTVAPYGTWKSPVSADLLTQKNVSFGDIAVLQTTKEYAQIAYVENRPQEGGRAALVTRCVALGKSVAQQGVADDATEVDLSRGDLNVRTGVHEYGGGAVAADLECGAVFTDYKSYNVYIASKDGKTLDKITAENKALRYADFSHHPTLPFIAAVQEDHTIDEPSKVVNTIVVLDKRSRACHVIASGHDFYSSPRFSPDGQYIAWVSWDHPSMPFWATETWVAKFDAGTAHDTPPKMTDAVKVAGNNDTEVAHYPLWIAKDTLLYTRDTSGYSNPYTVSLRIEKSALKLDDHGPLLKGALRADFVAPAWQLNNSTYAQLSEEWMICSPISKGASSLALLNLKLGTIKHLQSPFVSVTQLRVLDASTIIFIGVQETAPSALVVMDLSDAFADGETSFRIIKWSSTVVEDGIVPGDFLSKAQRIEYPTQLPDGTSATAHALLFPPRNPGFVAPAGTLPPCILKIHGGPTSCASLGANLGTSYWTSRGYSICQVNYGGSTSYGREYMERLNAQWGVVDVRDAAAAASFLGSASGSSDNSDKVSRIMTASAREEIECLQEERLPGGGIRYTLTRVPHRGEFVLDFIIAIGIAVVATYLFTCSVQSGSFTFLAVLLLCSFMKVRQERLTVLPGLGLQIDTIRGLQLPRLAQQGNRTKLFAASAYGNTIPRDRILDIFTKEAINRWRVVDYLAVATATPARTARKFSESSHHSDAKLTILFPHLQPHLPVVEKVYKGVHSALFGESSAQEAEKNMNPRVDANRIAISGGSAGGYTVLASLCLYPDVFKAGTSLYGVSRIAGLAESSHKFESEYVNRLMGGPPEQIPQVYHDRSPLYMADRIKSPVILMQGDIDKVVPPEQSESIYKILQEQGVKTKYILFEGEGHGFRKAENIKTSLYEEEAWYKDIFNL